ncbi:toll/interleukin-1 receptor domain-containing protein [Leptolyngbya sp. CCNP1308]|uniref:toll/interleukin-1 receptor domain-containing protein n=1 Tax=Leptolyngbya sp. CCNP1308 TaxID=3110255 RepID=UPI002B20BDD4|nr:toll/interleukin-1 receptor domain-containing protein [Leptolyngbya sp. CCNP1308]MEA5447565.1 toll/interleukin-1 receptor domain-containing protein [Leptolyngbya sp. CCNP1308]
MSFNRFICDFAAQALAGIGGEEAIQALQHVSQTASTATRLGFYVKQSATRALEQQLRDSSTAPKNQYFQLRETVEFETASRELEKLGIELSIPKLVEALEHYNYTISSNANSVLKFVGKPSLLSDLWSFCCHKPSDKLWQIITTIQNRCNFYNYEIFQSIIPQGSTISLYFSYAPADEVLQAQLANHLTLLERQGVITSWSQRQTLPGDDRDQIVNQQLNTADIILLLISANSLADDTCYDLEIQRAIERYQAGKARVIPILLRPVDWAGLPFSQLEVLPKNHQPVTTWANPDAAFQEIAEGIRAIALDWRQRHSSFS